MGFAVCLVIGSEGYNVNDFDQGCFDVRYYFHIETGDDHKEGFFHYSIAPFNIRPDEHNELICPDHILLGYNLSRKCYEFFQELDTLLANRGMSDYVGTTFEFNLEQMYYSLNGVETCKVKHCGIQPTYVQAQVMNSVAINQDTEDTSRSNDTEETCESNPKRICTEANQCS
ncbi:hypothetical protein Ddye_019702 [Dipteronia dyeriana]|uniref:Uncharacterized protein n=1 Tax=Dipteronia dyeriana TaxID=168575 RepID=A0AAD9WVZ7_9ROSI|nr:hypothetical protein Ddye_019702 [Dipteronia dyeriana]